METQRPASAGDSAPDSSATTLIVVPTGLRAEFFSDDSVERLARASAGGVAWLDGGADLTAALGAGRTWPRAEILVTAWGTPPLDVTVLDALPALRLVAHTGATVRPFVTAELFDRGVLVTQAGQGMARSVAEVALSFTLALLHQTHRFDHALRSGVAWGRAETAPPRHEILGTAIGVIGASRTGRAYIEVVRALGADVIVSDPYLGADEARALGVRRAGLDEVLATSRIAAVHAPSLAETRHMIGARELALLADGSGLVNTARSWLVDEEALVAEVTTGRIDAALDVFDAEPLPVDHPLRGLPNVLLTPHHAAATVECRLRQGRIVVEEVERLGRGADLEHAVGPAELRRMG